MPYTPLQELKTEGLTEMFGEFNFDDLDSDDEVPERNDRRSGVCSFCLNFDIFLVNSQKLGVQAPENTELKNWFCNLTFISLVWFVYVLVIYSIFLILFNK